MNYTRLQCFVHRRHLSTVLLHYSTVFDMPSLDSLYSLVYVNNESTTDLFMAKGDLWKMDLFRSDQNKAVSIKKPYCVKLIDYVECLQLSNVESSDVSKFYLVIIESRSTWHIRKSAIIKSPHRLHLLWSVIIISWSSLLIALKCQLFTLHVERWVEIGMSPMHVALMDDLSRIVRSVITLIIFYTQEYRHRQEASVA